MAWAWREQFLCARRVASRKARPTGLLADRSRLDTLGAGRAPGWVPPIHGIVPKPIALANYPSAAWASCAASSQLPVLRSGHQPIVCGL